MTTHKNKIGLLPRKKVAFLFLHEQPHQMPHCAPILSAMAEKCHEVEIEAFVRGQNCAQFLWSLLSERACARITIKIAYSPGLVGRFEQFLGGAAPLSRVGILAKLRFRLADFDMIVAPETTSMMLKTVFGVTKPKMVYTEHGAGDRAVGFKKIFSKFDLVLTPGEKVRNRMLAENVIKEGNYSVVGYPKFDFVDGLKTKEQYRERQEKAFIKTFGANIHGSADRAANAIVSHLFKVKEVYARDYMYPA